MGYIPGSSSKFISSYRWSHTYPTMKENSAEVPPLPRHILAKIAGQLDTKDRSMLAHSSQEMYEMLHKTNDYSVVSQKEPVVLLTKHVDPVSFSCVSGDGRVGALVNWRYEDGAVEIDRYRIPRLTRTRTTIRTCRKYKESACVGELSRSGEFLAFGGGNDLKPKREAGEKIFHQYQYDFLLCRFSGGVAEKVAEHQLAGQVNDIKFSFSEEFVAVKFDDRRILVLNTLGHMVWRKSFDAVYDRIPLQLSVSFTPSNDLLIVENYPDLNEFLRSGPMRLWSCPPPFFVDKAPREMTTPPENLHRAGRQAFVDGNTLIYVHRKSSCLEAYEIRSIEDLEDEYNLSFRSSYDNEEFFQISKIVAPKYFKFSEVFAFCPSQLALVFLKEHRSMHVQLMLLFLTDRNRLDNGLN